MATMEVPPADLRRGDRVIGLGVVDFTKRVHDIQILIMDGGAVFTLDCNRMAVIEER